MKTMLVRASDPRFDGYPRTAVPFGLSAVVVSDDVLRRYMVWRALDLRRKFAEARLKRAIRKDTR